MNSQGFSPYLLPQDIVPNGIKQSHLYATPAAKGDMYYGNDGVNFARLAIGSSYQILSSVGGIPAWTTFPQTGVATSRPSAGRFTGDLYFATDTHVLSLWDGTTWRTSTFT